MKIKNLTLLISGILLLSATPVICQKAFVETTAKVEALARVELDHLMLNQDFLVELQKRNIVGSYTYQITVKEKGQVGSMLFIEKSEDANITGQNYFNKLVRKHKFSFKVPKGNYYKFNYTFVVP